MSSFATEKQAEYESDLLVRFGDKVQEDIEHSNQNTKGWKVQDWNKASQEFTAICKDLTFLLEKKYTPDSPEVQEIVARHYVWIKQFWVPNKESYAGLAQGYEQEEWKKTFEPYHPELAHYLSQAIQFFAQKL